MPKQLRHVQASTALDSGPIAPAHPCSCLPRFGEGGGVVLNVCALAWELKVRKADKEATQPGPHMPKQPRHVQASTALDGGPIALAHPC